MTTKAPVSTGRAVQFEVLFDPNIEFRADRYPHWEVKAKVEASQKLAKALRAA